MAGIFDLTGKTALVTGASGGIGAEIARLLHGAGATVGLSGTRVDPLEALKADLGERAHVLPCNLSDAEAVEALPKQAVVAMGSVDILVNNAGITRDMTFKKMGKPDWDAVMKTNLDSVFNMTKPVCDGMVERNWGRVINVSSVNGQKGAFGQTNYSAAKAGMHGFTKALALEVARKGVTVNTISPGYIGTKMVMAIPKDILDTKIVPQIPVGRLGKPDEVAGLIIYLCSEEAAFVTGANIAINGGQHMY
jgi:acetoacetyl-CoA reductase